MNIALIDDHQMLTDSIRNILAADPLVQEVRTFTSAEEFLSAALSTWFPDIIITDLLMPGGMTGLELVEKIKQSHARGKFKIIILSSVTDVQVIRQAVKAGVSGYLSKNTSIKELMEAIYAVQAGEQYIAHKLRDSLINHLFTEEQVVSHLSPREKDVLHLICSGHTIKEAAYELSLSVHTVQGYHKNIMKKFKVNRTADLIVYAIQKGLYCPPLR